MASESIISASQLNAAVSSVRADLAHARRDLHQEIGTLRKWTEKEIQRLEREMMEVGKIIVHAINQQTAAVNELTTAVNQQTVAVVSGVAETTAKVEGTRQQIEQDFGLTRNKLDTQTESVLQIEVGKKVGDAGALKSKLDAFFNDIKERFDKSIAGVAINRELYNLNFQKITDEYESKVRTIGSHIFQVKLEDIAPAVRAAHVPYEEAHSLPIEMDLARLSARAENLDQTLEMLRQTRLDEVLNSLGVFDATLQRFAAGIEMPGIEVSLCIEGIATVSPVSTRVLAGVRASNVGPNDEIVLTTAERGFEVYSSSTGCDRASAALVKYKARDLSGEEIIALSKAAATLHDRNFISKDAKLLFEEFLGTGNLKYVEA